MLHRATTGMLTTAIALVLTAVPLSPSRLAAEVAPSHTADANVTITAKSGSEEELHTKAQLERLLDAYDLEPFLQTREVQVVAGVIPHSHPVLTVNTKYLDSDLHLLTTFVHEQLHWLTSDRDEQVTAAIAEFRQRFTDVPVRGGEGGRDEHSTYLHLIVCDLELQAMTALVGADTARKTLAEANHYKWIYRQVLEDPTIREINARHGFIVP